MVSRYKFYDEGCGVRSSIIMCIFELGFRPFTSLIFVFRLLSNDDSAAGRRRNIITMGSSDRGRNVLSTYERAFAEKFCPTTAIVKPSIVVWRSSIFKLVNQHAFAGRRHGAVKF